MFENQKKTLIDFAVKVYREGMVLGTGGNLSLRVGEKGDMMIITPSGMEYEKLQVEDMVVMDLDNNIVEGNRKPSIEFAMHSLVYKTREDVSAIMHTHALYSTAISITRTPLPEIESNIVLGVRGPVMCGKYANHGTVELAENVVEALGNRQAALLANHGLIVVGNNLDSCHELTLGVEHCARMYIMASSVGNPVAIEADKADALRNFVSHSYGQGDSEGGTNV